MKVKIQKVNQHHGIIIPDAILRRVGLKLHDPLDLSVQGSSIVLSQPSDVFPRSLEELFKNYDGTHDEKIVFDDAQGREIW